MNCPRRKAQIRPNRCLTCEHFGGFNNGGVLCFKANRRIEYHYEGKTAADFTQRHKS